MSRTPWKTQPPHACIAEVLPESIAEELGLQPGDVILAVNGEPVTDYIAYRFAITDEEVTLEVARGDERAEMEIEKDVDEDLGIVFAGDVFDGVRACRNNCVFCFEEQMPAGMRPSLRLRDDDFRLSFLHGNFLTLTNLREEDWQRIFRENLSPLFVSIHATDPEVRRRMLQNRRAPDIREQLRRLAEGGIEVHGQIVLCPGWNDGAVLEQTLADLAALYPAIATVGIVPVGLTGHRPGGPEVRRVNREDALAALATVARWQEKMLATHDTRVFFAADEFYLTTGSPLPPADAYEGYPQRENGIGLARIFLDELATLDLASITDKPPVIVTLATGTLAAPLVTRLAEKLRASGHDLTVIPVPNLFYGGGVSVAGLLTGSDLLAALKGRELGDALLLPAVMRNADGIFLDDMTPAAIEQALGMPLHFCAGPEDVVETLAHLHQ